MSPTALTMTYLSATEELGDESVSKPLPKAVSTLGENRVSEQVILLVHEPQIRISINSDLCRGDNFTFISEENWTWRRRNLTLLIRVTL